MALQRMTLTALLVFVSALYAAMAQTTTTSCLPYPPCSSVTPISQPYFYPDFNDCNKYWECVNGQAFYRTCPAGQEFDLRDFSCQFPPTSSQDFRVTCGVLFTGLAGLSG